MKRTPLLSLSVVALAASLIYLAPGFAQQADEDPAPPADAPAQNAPAEAEQDQPSADDVLEDMLRRRENNPVIEPSDRPDADADAAAEYEPSRAAQAVAGIAPGASDADLRREGQFVITRRGRMVRAPGDITGWVFVFEADSSGMSEPPMYLMPCQLLEDMEKIVQEHGDSVVFTLSGQIYLYHGANYLLPTLMQLAPDRGNIEP